MDKQRELFEKAYVKTDYYKIHYEKTNASNSTFSWNNEVNRYTWHDVNSSWEMWQEAQKVAVPEGYVLVPKEPTELMHEAGKDMVTFGCGYADIYKAMIETQE